MDDPNASFYIRNYAAILTTCTNIGAMVSALFAAKFAKYGLWKMIIYTNIFVFAASAICMVDNSGVILFGRFLYGMASGAFTVYVPKYVSLLTPKEYRGSFGSVS